MFTTYSNVFSFYHIFLALPSLLQALYERLFGWIVSRINSIIEVKDYNPVLHGKNTVIGVLDIYGFEIFDNNRWVSQQCFDIRPLFL